MKASIGFMIGMTLPLEHQSISLQEDHFHIGDQLVNLQERNPNLIRNSVKSMGNVTCIIRGKSTFKLPAAFIMHRAASVANTRT